MKESDLLEDKSMPPTVAESRREVVAAGQENGRVRQCRLAPGLSWDTSSKEVGWGGRCMGHGHNKLTRPVYG